MKLTTEEKMQFIRWVVKNIDETIVPADEGSDDGIRYNLVHAIIGDNFRFAYKDEECEEVELYEDDIETFLTITFSTTNKKYFKLKAKQ